MKFSSSVFAGTLLLTFVASVAQQSSTPVKWAEGAPNATSEVKNDTKIEGLKTDDVHMFVSMADLKDTEYNRVWVQIANHGKAPLDFDPQAATLMNEKEKVLRAEIPDKAANSVQKFGEAKQQELASPHCENMVATQCQPTTAQMQLSKQVAAFSAQQAGWIRTNAIAKKQLAPGEDVQGIIVFKKEKKAATYTLRIPIGTQVFEFLLSAQNKQPSYD